MPTADRTARHRALIALALAAAGALTIMGAAPAGAAEIAAVSPNPVAAGGDITVTGDCTGTVADAVAITITRFDVLQVPRNHHLEEMLLDASQAFSFTYDTNGIDSPGVEPGDFYHARVECWSTAGAEGTWILVQELGGVVVPIDGEPHVDPEEPPTDPGEAPADPPAVNPGVEVRTGLESTDPLSPLPALAAVAFAAAGLALVRRRSA